MFNCTWHYTYWLVNRLSKINSYKFKSHTQQGGLMPKSTVHDQYATSEKAGSKFHCMSPTCNQSVKHFLNSTAVPDTDLDVDPAYGYLKGFLFYSFIVVNERSEIILVVR